MQEYFSMTQAYFALKKAFLVMTQAYFDMMLGCLVRTQVNYVLNHVPFSYAQILLVAILLSFYE